ncbi:hypothetical protein [Staphylococcus phage vB_StaM_SA1]|nr:hypothetical protein [Staphylococcus phage vB_StaM_SA1]
MRLKYFLKNKGKQENHVTNHLEEEKWYLYLIDNVEEVNVKYNTIIRLDNGFRVSVTCDIIDVKATNLGPIFNEFDVNGDVYILQSKVKYYFNNEEFLETIISYDADSIDSYEKWITFCKENIPYEVRSSLNEKLNKISNDEFNINNLLIEIKSERDKTLLLNSEKEKEITNKIKNNVNSAILPIISKEINGNLEELVDKSYDQFSDKFEFRIYNHLQNHNELNSSVKICNRLLKEYFTLTGNKRIKIATEFKSFKEVNVFHTSDGNDHLYLGFKLNGKTVIISIYENNFNDQLNIVTVHNIEDLLPIK